MKEIDLIQARARRMSSEEIRAEIARAQRGLKVAQSASAERRYETRIRLMTHELTSRGHTLS